MKIPGKTALILGAAKGIGKHISLALASAGAKVVLTYYDWPEESRQMREEFAALGHEHLAAKVDLRKTGEIAGLFDKIENRFGGLDILINNIERGGMPVVHGPYTPEQWDLEMETTLKAKWFVFNRALPLLKASGDGTAINISSIAALVGRSGPAGLIFNDGYSAANRAVSSFTETWARQGAPEVRVNELMLGFFETRHAEGTRGWPLLSGGEQQAIINHTLLGRTGRIADIIKAVFFLIEDACYMTGGVIRLDGGYTLGSEKVPPMPAGVL
ncbi:MAG: SDR family oxidoreductase [Desulfobulbaceae bacterium]|nr:SDR family oxidoreductase [Desulfobulbaceae bacterium]